MQINKQIFSSFCTVLYNFFNRISSRYNRIRTYWLCSVYHFPYSTSIGRNVSFKGVDDIHLSSNICFNQGCIIETWRRFKNYNFDSSIIIGDNCSFGEFTHITSCNKVLIGRNVLIGRFVLITDNSHGSFFDDLNIPPRDRTLYSKGPVIIKDNVWIGDKVSILSGVSIGENSIIATGAIVTKDVPANCIVAGCPAKIIKQK